MNSSPQSSTTTTYSQRALEWLGRLHVPFEDWSLLWKLLGLIFLLIMVALAIGYSVFSTTEKYVIQREIMDLQDETEIAKLRIEKKLSNIQSSVLANVHLLQSSINSDVEPSDEVLKVLGQQCGAVEKPSFIRASKLREVRKNPEGELAKSLKLPSKLIVEASNWTMRESRAQKATDAFWSDLEWETKEHLQSAAPVPKGESNYLGDDIALVTIVVPVIRDEPNASGLGEKSAESNQEPYEGFVFVRFDVTSTLTRLFDPRSFVTLVSNDMQPVMLPFGKPSTNLSGMGKYLTDVLDQYQDSINNSSEAALEGRVYPAPQPGKQAWKDFDEVFGISIALPCFIESQDLSLAAIENLENNAAFLAWQSGPPPPGDPLRSVTTPSPDFRRIRARASNSEALEQLKGKIAEFVGKETVAWNTPRPQSNVVLNVHAIEAPGGLAGASSREGRKPFLYLVRAVSEKEISGAVQADLKNLIWYTIFAVAISMFLACVSAMLLIRPLRIMAKLARQIGSLELSNQVDLEKAKHWIASLPSGKRNEAGILGVELKGMVEQLLTANAGLRASQVELQQARDSLDMRVKLKTRELETQRDIANEASRAKSIFLATTSHDMRQPLHVVFTHCELLRDSGLDQEQLESLDFIEKNAKRLKFLTNDILDYQRLLSGELILRCEQVPVKAMLDELAFHMNDKAEEGNNRLQVRCDFQEEIYIDRPRLERILVNLLSNSCKFTRRGSIELEAYAVAGGKIEFRVHDTGQGMNDEQKKRLFEPLMSSRHRGHDGTGLGLYICKGITESMGGELRFESTLGVGTTFFVRLPVHVESTAESADPIASSTPAASPSKNSSSRIAGPADTISAHATSNVVANQRASLPNANASRSVDTSRSVGEKKMALIIDDDPNARRVLTEILTRLDYVTIEAEDGLSGLRLAREHRPDVISLDVIMDGMDGWEVLAELKSDPFTEGIPVVMATVLPDMQKGNVLGADGYVTKPFSTASVSSVIEKALRESGEDLILIVDDEQLVRQDLRRMIESCGWRVIEAADGIEALDQIHQKVPGLAIVDLDMPNMDGFALIEKLRQAPETEKLPIIVLSAMTVDQEQQSRLRMSVNRFFGKGGLELPALNEEITKLLQRHHQTKTQEPRS